MAFFFKSHKKGHSGFGVTFRMVLTLRYDDEKGDANLSELYKIPKEFQWRLRPLEMITSTFEESIRL